MEKWFNQMIKLMFGELFLCILLIPEMSLIDKYISKGNIELFRYYITIIILAKIFIVAIIAIIIWIKYHRHEKRLREEGE